MINTCNYDTFIGTDRASNPKRGILNLLPFKSLMSKIKRSFDMISFDQRDKKEKLITKEMLDELFSFDFIKGQLIRIISLNGSTAKKGDIAGHVSGDGYRRVQINKKEYCEHRLFWFYKYGYFPEYEIDHINRDRADNSFDNLREVTPQCNRRNSSKRFDNTSGITGVTWDKLRNKWRVKLKVADKHMHFGSFVDKSDAAMKRYEAEVKNGWGECNPNSSAYVYLKERGLI